MVVSVGFSLWALVKASRTKAAEKESPLQVEIE